jgi:outer membrane immunogenic protein
MKMMLKAFCLASALVSTPALANDDGTARSGPRIEAIFGYDRVSVGEDQTNDFNVNAEDVTYGAVIGYDISDGMISFGVEAEIATSGLAFEDRAENELLFGSLVSGRLRIDSNPEYYLGARLGYGSGNSIFYLKAGYAMSSVDIDADGFIDSEPVSFDGDIDLDGLRLGIGFEYGITDNFFVKTEYRFTDYTGGEIEALGQSLDLDAALDTIDLQRHQVVVGAGLRF